MIVDGRIKTYLRRRAIRKGFSDKEDVAIVVVNWNSLGFLKYCISAIRKCSRPDIRITVVDNASMDGSRTFLKDQEGIRRIFLPVNIGHDHAMDIGFLLSDAEYLVSLDVDAFPISERWLEKLLQPLAGTCVVSGCEAYRHYVHPCCLAIRKKDFVLKKHTFVANHGAEGLGKEAWDTGELISIKEKPHIWTFEHSYRRGPGWLGTIWADLIYHNFYAVRHRFYANKQDLIIENVVLDGDIRAEDAILAWDEALKKYFPDDAKG